MKKKNAEMGLELAADAKVTIAKNTAVRIGSVTELQAIIDSPMVCSFELDGRAIEVEVTRLSASTHELVRGLQRRAQPPYDKERKEYDQVAPQYLAQRDQYDRWARSLIVYRHCPMVAEGKPGLTKNEEIHAYVSGLFSELVLDVISLKVQGGGISLDDRTNFT